MKKFKVKSKKKIKKAYIVDYGYDAELMDAKTHRILASTGGHTSPDVLREDAKMIGYKVID